MAEGQEEPKKITITVKTPKEKQQVDIEEDADIKKLKEVLSPKFSAEPEQLCLIFAGKIMNDADTLKQHNIKDGLTVHLVIKTPPRPEPEGAARRPPADIGATPFGLNSLGGLAGLESLGLGQSTFMDLQARMQQELLSNPDMLRQVLDNPLVQQMMNDPENMRTLITSNPQMQDLMSRNPEISHMLNNPELLRQTMELARNPAMLQELMRSHDRALSNLESIPGGYNALQRMYRDIQEPMLNVASSMAGNPFSGLVDNSDGTNPQQGSENRQPLPNPWQRGGGPGAGAGTAAPGLINTPGMQSLLQQMSENPRLVQSMLSAPYTNDMLQALAADPEMASQLINQNPMFANNPQLQEQIRTMMPQMLAQLQNPEMQQMMSNPQFATVYKARDVKTDKIVAVKKIKIGSRLEAQDGINRTALREIKLLQELQHVNLIGLLDVFGQKSNVSLVFDFMDTDLEIIVKDNNIVLTPANVKAYMIMTLKGLEYLHLNWILHRDLKPNNLLINREGILKIGDFGLAKAFGSPTRINTHQVVTRWYRSPELLFGARQYGTGVDMWAIGCILAELLLRVPFLPGESDLDQLSRIFQVFGTPTEETWPGMKSLTDYVQFKQFPPQQLRHIFSAASDDLIQLLESLLSIYPPKRCNCAQALQMPYFSNKPAPTVGTKLPMPSNISKVEAEKPSLKRKLLENIDGGSLAKRLQF